MRIAAAVDSSADALSVYKTNFSVPVSCVEVGPGRNGFAFPEPRERLHVHFSPPCQELSNAKRGPRSDSGLEMLRWSVEIGTLLALSGSDVRGPRPVEGPSHPQLDRRWSLHLRRSPNRGRRQQPVIWVNQVVGTTHVVNNETGDHIACNAFGKPIPPFHPGVSGVANTKERLELELKVRPARARRPVQGRKPASLVFVAWPADVPCVCGMVAGREMGEVAAEEGAAEATAAGAGAAAGARVNHRPIRWEDAGRDRPAPEQAFTRALARSSPCGHPPRQPPTNWHGAAPKTREERPAVWVPESLPCLPSRLSVPVAEQERA